MCGDARFRSFDQDRWDHALVDEANAALREAVALATPMVARQMRREVTSLGNPANSLNPRDAGRPPADPLTS